MDLVKFRIGISLLFIFLSSCPIWAQTKYEKEYRLKEHKVPAQAIEFVAALPFDKKIKWFKEEGLDTNSVEAKTKFRSQKYSIEFDQNGILEDIEIEEKWKAKKGKTKEVINTHLQSNFEKYKVLKSQVQYTGTNEGLIAAIKSQAYGSAPGITTRYELVVKTKKQRTHQKMEFLFDDSGVLLQQLIILPKNTDNLEY